MIELLLRFSNILADLGPELQFLIIAKAVVSGSGAVARHPPFTNKVGQGMCKEYEQLTADQNPRVLRTPDLKQQVVNSKGWRCGDKGSVLWAVGVDTLDYFGT